MRLEHHLVGGYVRYISPYIILLLLKAVLEAEFDVVNKILSLYNTYVKCKSQAF